MGKIPKKYIPKHLSQKDYKKQKKNITETRKLYDKKIYKNRPFTKSFKSRKSNHVKRAKEQYGVNSIVASKTLAKRTGCTRKGLRKILKKGRGGILQQWI
jgi:hypothetical protein